MEYTLPPRGDPGYWAAIGPIVADLLTRTSIPVATYPVDDDHGFLDPGKMGAFLEDVLDEHWPVFLMAVDKGEPDICQAVRRTLRERFPGSTIPPIVPSSQGMA